MTGEERGKLKHVRVKIHGGTDENRVNTYTETSMQVQS